MKFGEEIEKIGKPGNPGSRYFFEGTSYEVEVIRRSPKEDFYLRTPDVRFLIRCKDTFEVMQQMSAWLSRFSMRKKKTA